MVEEEKELKLIIAKIREKHRIAMEHELKPYLNALDRHLLMKANNGFTAFENDETKSRGVE